MEDTILIRMPFLSAAENRETFFRRIAHLFPKTDPRYRLIEKAYNQVKDAFRGIEREGGERYFEHIRAVVLIMIDHLRITDYRMIIAALLHDIVEDIEYWSIARVAAEYDEKIAWLVDYMTKPPKSEYPTKAERDDVYHFRFRSAPREFFLIKLSDRLHNLLSLGACPPEKRSRKIEETYRYYLPYAEQHFIMLHELEWALKRAKQE